MPLMRLAPLELFIISFNFFFDATGADFISLIETKVRINKRKLISYLFREKVSV